jgi:hypothetical protein
LWRSCSRSGVEYLLVGRLLLYFLDYGIGLSSAAIMTPGTESFLDLAVYYYATTTKFMDKSITSNAFVASCDADRPLQKMQGTYPSSIVLLVNYVL